MTTDSVPMTQAEVEMGEIEPLTDDAGDTVYSGSTYTDDDGNEIPIPMKSDYIDLGFSTPMVTGIAMREGDETDQTDADGTHDLVSSIGQWSDLS